MLTNKHWDILSDGCNVPCFVADLETANVLFANDKMKQLFPGEKKIIGAKFYDLLRNDSTITNLDFMTHWKTGDVFQHKIFDLELCRGFQSTHMNILWNEKGYHYIKLLPTENVDFNFEDTISQCISIVQRDENEKIDALLEMLGKFYLADHSYFFQMDYQNRSIPSVASWHKSNDTSLVENLSEEIDFSEILSLFQRKNQVGIMEISENHSNFCEDSTEAKVLSTLKIKNILFSVLEDENQAPLAMVAVCNRGNVMADLRLLQAISSFLEKDVTETNITMQQMNAMDILTGFYSRSTYHKKLERLRYQPPKQLGVVFININGLKKINQEFGLAKGDSYIKKATEILTKHFEGDFYRISGDEFVGFFPDMPKTDFKKTITQLQGDLKEKYNRIFALGYAWKENSVDVMKLVSEADTVMYINKQEYYHNALLNDSEFSDNTLQDLLQALENEEFFVHLQPQMNLKEGTLYGAEALVRRMDKVNNKIIYPDQFISKYEKKSIIRHVDIFVIEKVCQILSSWLKRGQQIPISVNLSRVTLLEYDIVETIAEICDKHQVPRELLVIEVTERVGLVENTVPSGTITHALTQKGFRLSLDDFGCAYSNIVTLSQIDVDEVKIDKSLVDFLNINEKNQILVKNILSMCRDLNNTSTLAEGIESQEQAELLKNLGCHFGQGYFYSKPISEDDFTKKYLKNP